MSKSEKDSMQRAFEKFIKLFETSAKFQNDLQGREQMICREAEDALHKAEDFIQSHVSSGKLDADETRIAVKALRQIKVMNLAIYLSRSAGAET